MQVLPKDNAPMKAICYDGNNAEAIKKLVSTADNASEWVFYDSEDTMNDPDKAELEIGDVVILHSISNLAKLWKADMFKNNFIIVSSSDTDIEENF